MEEKIQTMMRNLGLTREEALALIADDDEIDKMPMSKVNADIEPVVVKEIGAEVSLTDNQQLALDIINSNINKEFTASDISNASDGKLSSRGLGSVMRKLIDLNLVNKIDGRPVKYKAV